MATLFKLQVPGGGSFTVTSPAAKVYLLSFESPPDNRLTTPFLQTYLTALDIIELRHERGVLISTSSIAKFFSNGLDLEHVVATPGFWRDSLFPLFRRLLTYPMPTIALINGHAFAGGLMVAMYHDYRIQNPSKGFLCLNEVLFGALLESPMMSIFKAKVSPITFKRLVLEGHRFGAQQALTDGIVDGLGGLDETLRFIEDRELTRKAEAGVYGGLKEEMYRDTLNILRDTLANESFRRVVDAENDALRSLSEQRVEAWKSGTDKAKL